MCRGYTSDWPLSNSTVEHPDFETLHDLVQQAARLSAKIEKEVFGGPETADDYWFNVAENISVLTDMSINDILEGK